MKRRSGILGGTFNPVHVGHLRLALEAAERLELDRVVLMPNHTPAHKEGKGLLPFQLRVELLRAATADSPRLDVTTLEGDLPSPSYTWNSLEAWKAENPRDEGIFILGAEDFARLDTWYRGNDLPSLMDFAVMARAGAGRERFVQTLARLWPEAGKPDDQGRAVMPGGRTCRFLEMPTLDISASLVRTKWLQQHDIRFLVPDPALRLFHRYHDAVSDCWREGL